MAQSFRDITNPDSGRLKSAGELAPLLNDPKETYELLKELHAVVQDLGRTAASYSRSQGYNDATTKRAINDSVAGYKNRSGVS